MISLDRDWIMTVGEQKYACSVPCSLYDTLLKAGKMEDPYWGENQWEATELSDQDIVLERVFSAPAEILQADRAELCFEGIDTLAEVWLNGEKLGSCDNMHRTWRYQVLPLLRAEDNLLRVEIRSPLRYIRDQQARRPLWGVGECAPGYPHLRKAHCMFGWDWGPDLPDMGIWRPVTLRGYRAGRIREAYFSQRHEEGRVRLTCRAAIEHWGERPLTCRWQVTGPEGEAFFALLRDGQAEIEIRDPKLWWVRGLGDQPLYHCRLELMDGEDHVDALNRDLGLRTLTISQEEDEWGKEFCFVNNGVKVFAMGANYIPEDQLIPRVTRQRTEKLLADCAGANYNFIRVWGGGWYPEESFYDWCDRHGLMVWQDFMFACSAYRLTPEFEATVRQEIRDNLIRLRNHPSLALWCGNNEIESAWEGWNLPEDPQAKADYLTLFEKIIPEAAASLDPDTFYWPSSPSSGGGFRDSSSNRAGDMHYWAVWHNFKPIEAFRQFYYRFCSEYGFESLPEMKTIRAFAEEKDLELNSHVMTAHQKCSQGNEKVMYYLAQMVNYPWSFDRMVYCSQLVQADCIRSNVEHMRRARGRCMGSAYWQVNDSNPVISWSSIDYFGRWKALHYAARKFYAPLLLSCDDTDAKHPALYITNDTREDMQLILVCRLRDNGARVLREWRQAMESPALSARLCMQLDLTENLGTRQELRTRYLEYQLLEGDTPVSGGTTAFVRPKDFDFLPARVTWEAEEEADCFRLTLRADAWAKSVRLGLKNHDAVFSDNFFDIHGQEPVRVKLRKKDGLEGMTLADLRAELEIDHYGAEGFR